MDDEIQIEFSTGMSKQDNDPNENDQCKTSNIPTLMITVKNEIAQSANTPIIPTDGKIIIRIFLIISFIINLDSTEPATLRHIFSDATYFLIKSGNEENISLAKSKGVWSTPPANEQKLNRAFRVKNCFFVFNKI